jgi:hypothetical protein
LPRPLTPEALAAAVAPAYRALERALRTHAPPALLDAWRARLGHHQPDALLRGLAQSATYAALLARHAAPAGWLAQALADLRALPRLAPAFTQLAKVPTDPAIASPSFHLFEHLLAASDAGTRTSVGAYYTPIELVSAQVALTGAALHGIDLEWNDPRVHILDPACGTGIYPHTIVTRHRVDPDHLHACELLPGPAIAAHGHLTAAGLARPNIHCRDTLSAELPSIIAPTDTLVCLGNPPYSRHPAARATHPLKNFLPPHTAGIHAKNLYNDYVYFWHWALSTALAPGRPGGLVCFVTAASWLRGPGFATMREHIKSRVDDLWILDLGGDSLGPQKSPNIFNRVRIPVCIALAVRRGPEPAPAPNLWYTRLGDALSRDDRLRLLAGVRTFADLPWDRLGPSPTFIPTAVTPIGDSPRLIDMFPWQHSGAQFKRTWPIGQTRELLERRWQLLLDAPDRAAAFHETRDRLIIKPAPALHGDPAPALATLAPTAPPPPIARYAFRSLDRMWCLADARLGDFLRPPLWHSHGDRQIYLTSLLSVDAPSRGPAVIAAADIPDLHHYSGRGGADVLPLWRDPAATRPNVTAGLLDLLAATFHRPVLPEHLLAYVYAVLAHPAYTATLREPGPRVPLTRDQGLFLAAVDLGRDLLRWHTFGARMNPDAVPLHGQAAATTSAAATYPDHYTYSPDARQLRIGDLLTVDHVDPATWAYEVSGLKILPSWLGYRMQRPRGRASSRLDAVRPTAWTPDLTRELLELLWVLEHSLALHARQAELLARVLAAPRFTAADLPRPTPDERKPPP